MTSQSFSPPHPEIENHPLTPKVVEDETLGPRPENHPPKPEGSFPRLFSMPPMTPPTHTNVNIDYYSKPVLPPLHTCGEGWNASSGEALQTASPMPKPQKPDLRKELLLQSIEQPSRSSSVATTFVDWSPSPTPPPNARRVAPREKNKTSSLYSTPASFASASETLASETPEPPAKRKFSRGKTLTISDKLVLIRLCCENKGDIAREINIGSGSQSGIYSNRKPGLIMPLFVKRLKDGFRRSPRLWRWRRWSLAPGMTRICFVKESKNFFRR